jgi:hypothetical protein
MEDKTDPHHVSISRDLPNLQRNIAHEKKLLNKFELTTAGKYYFKNKVSNE